MYTKIALLKIESTSIALHVAGVSTITFFEGELENIEDEIRIRFKEILDKNPWLCSKLVKNKKHKRLDMVYPTSAQESDMNRIVQINPKGLIIDSQMNYAELSLRVRPHLVKSPSSMINKDKYVSSLILVQDSKVKSRFALIFSLSHSVADGHTYYSIFNMLSNKSDITALNVDRKEHVIPEIIEAFGQKQYNYLKSIGHVVNVFKGIFFAGKSKAYIYYIDENKIETLKKDVQNEGEFISTNDILTSSFSKFVHARISLMAINFRDKLSGLSQKDAGNYEGAVLYDKEVYENPLSIRKSLKSIPYIGLSENLPSVFEGMLCNMGLITNWSSFCQEIFLSGAKQTLHLPITNSAGKAPYEMAVVFRPTADKLGVIYFTHKFNANDYINSELPLGNSIYN